MATAYAIKGGGVTQFQSTPPTRVATTFKARTSAARTYFNPRHPHGWRRPLPATLSTLFLFQSTPPTRVATAGRIAPTVYGAISIHATHTGGDAVWLAVRRYIRISIHATHTGGDCMLLRKRLTGAKFQSTPPTRVATVVIL